MRWIKKGQIFTMEPLSSEILTHASNPLAVNLSDSIFRIYFSGRDGQNRSSVGAVDMDLHTCKVVQLHKETLFRYGNPGTFYSDGVSIGNIYSRGMHRYILFMGWNIPPGQHWRGDIGRLELTANMKFELNPVSAFMGTDNEDPISLSYPWVMHHQGIYKMWYGSTVDWKTENGEMLHVIKYAESEDGISWNKKGIAIPYQLGKAQAFSRPTVIADTDGYHMWYSYRSGTGQTYRIGYAFSMDGLNWTRKHEECGIDVSASGWDSEMICYPYVFDWNGNRYMLYNGNQFGKEGFGLAILEK